MIAHPEAEAPMLRLLTLLAHNIATELAERLAAAGFGDQRLAHHAVFANVPAEGIRLTALAQRAGVSKQAMSELVASLEERHYVRRVPDPHDGRARLIAFTPRGDAAVDAALSAFRDIEEQLAEHLGKGKAATLRTTLLEMLTWTPVAR